MNVHVLDPDQVPGWDTLVRRLPGSTFFHGSAWARLLRLTYGFQPAYFAIRQDDSFRALLPCMEVRVFPGGPRGVSLPFTDHAGPLSESPAQIPALFDAMTRQGRARHWRTWECRGVPAWVPQDPTTPQYYQHTLDLTPGPETLFNQFDPAVRRALRKAARNRLRIQSHDSVAGMAAYYDLHCRTRRRHGLPPQPEAFFANLRTQVLLPGHGRLFLIHQGDRAIAGAIFLHWDRQVLFKFGASDEHRQGVRPNNLVMWHAIEAYAREGYTQLDFGRTSLANAGLRRYKLGWGTTESSLHYLKYDLRSNRVVPEVDRSTGWHTHLFRRLPLPLLRAIGARLYRHLA